MKRIAILSAVNIKHMSLIFLYTDILKKHGYEYDIIYMDKYGEDEAFECANKYRYVNVIKPDMPRVLKMAKYMTFLPYAARIRAKNAYDFIIVWNDLAIFMFADLLARKYKGKYCLNVRDNMGYEKKSRQKRYRRVFENAAFNTISSRGYLDFLPKGIKYLPIHSLNLSVLEGMQPHTAMRKPGEPIRIGFIGYIRFFERNQKLLDVFANDERFELHYYGKNADVLRKYAEVHGIKNTAFHDSFPVEDTKIYLEKIDIINNLYGNDTINLRKAISIKFFHALYARIPILVCDNTYVGKLAQEVGIGFEVKNMDEQMKDALYAWYTSREFGAFEKSCEKFLEHSVQENLKLEEAVMNCLTD